MSKEERDARLLAKMRCAGEFLDDRLCDLCAMVYIDIHTNCKEIARRNAELRRLA